MALALLLVAPSDDVQRATNALDDVVQRFRGELLNQLSVGRMLVAVIAVPNDIRDPLLLMAMNGPRASDPLDKKFSLCVGQEPGLVRAGAVDQNHEAVTQALDGRPICGRHGAHGKLHRRYRVVRKDRRRLGRGCHADHALALESDVVVVPMVDGIHFDSPIDLGAATISCAPAGYALVDQGRQHARDERIEGRVCFDRSVPLGQHGLRCPEPAIVRRFTDEAHSHDTSGDQLFAQCRACLSQRSAIQVGNWLSHLDQPLGRSVSGSVSAWSGSRRTYPTPNSETSSAPRSAR